ncbi:hypothetical protein D6783_01500 [Candidatus Woesearchaeota archaeon]|nr:MAG: hypothetical protein D6783_01500 [Candidatus Woesearchaeota archaeon]
MPKQLIRKGKELKDKEKFFHLWSGKDLKSIKELADHIRGISPDEFNHHVNEHKNDFANWVEHCFGEHKLATALRSCTSRTKMYEVLLNFLMQKSTAPRSSKARSKKKSPQQKRAKKAATNVRQASASTTKQEEQEKPAPTPSLQEGNTTNPPDDSEASPAANVQPSLEEEHQALAKHAESIMDSFDKKLQHIEHELQPEIPESAEKRLDTLNEAINELSASISALRKTGKDCFIPAVTLRLAKSRLIIAKATLSPSDLAAAESLINEARDDLKEVEAERPINIKEEVALLAKQKLAKELKAAEEEK